MFSRLRAEKKACEFFFRAYARKTNHFPSSAQISPKRRDLRPAAQPIVLRRHAAAWPPPSRRVLGAGRLKRAGQATSDRSVTMGGHASAARRAFELRRSAGGEPHRPAAPCHREARGVSAVWRVGLTGCWHACPREKGGGGGEGPYALWATAARSSRRSEQPPTSQELAHAA